MAVQGAMSFFAGYACATQCAKLPCRARLNERGKTFKLSILIHSATVNEIDGPGLVQNERPFVGITVGDKKKETELADWSQEKSQWCFREVITVEVNTTDDMSVVVDASKLYNLYVASVSVQNHRVGELCFPVASVLPRLRAEDRDADGLVYATPVMNFDITLDGKVAGRVYLSFETKNPPPKQTVAEASSCCSGQCGLASDNTGYQEYRSYSWEDECTTAAPSRLSDIGSDAEWWGPRFGDSRDNACGDSRPPFAVRGVAA